MILPTARTEDEAQLYLDLQPCPTCNALDTAWTTGLAVAEERMVIRYSGDCGNCGTRRSYDFGKPDAVTPRAGFPTFGGPEPSELLDAGEWLSISELTAGQVPTDDDAAAWRALSIAAAAVAEILKFIPAEQQDVPDSAFWSATGQQVRAAAPSRFQRDRLVVIRDTYREMAAQKNPHEEPAPQVVQARTLAEAYLYLDLAVSGGQHDVGTAITADPAVRYRRWIEQDKDADGDILRYTNPAGRVDIHIPTEAAQEAVAAESRFGSRPSGLIDAGQWLLVRDAYLQKATAAQQQFIQNPAERDLFVLALSWWELTIDACEEVLKFLHYTATEVPPAALWTPLGNNAYADSPERFTRIALEQERDFCVENFQQFFITYDPS